MAIRFPNLLRVLVLALMFMVPSFSGGGLQASVSDEVQSAADTVNTKMDSGDAKMKPVMDESKKTLIWVVWLLWAAVPLILFGSLIAYGVWQTKQNETAAATKTFVAVGIGAIFYFGVLAIFFT